MTHFSRVLVSLSVWIAAGSAFGHGNSSEQWRTVADPAPDPSLVVQVHNSPLGKQLIVANHGSKPLELKGPKGRSFLRIGPDGVSADVAAPVWHQTQNPGKRPLPKGAGEDIAPDWRPISSEPSWGWFDPRLSDIDPEKDEANPKWVVPATLGNKSVALTGYSVSLSAARTLHHPRISRDSSAPQLNTKIIPDVVPAILVEYTGDKSIIVFSDDGGELLRLDASGVYANTTNEGWKKLGRPAGNTSTGKWERISPTPRYTWPDSRLLYTQSSADKNWTIPVREGDKEYAISGDWATIKLQH